MYKRDRNASYPGRSDTPFAGGARGILHRNNPDGNIRLRYQKSAEAIVSPRRAMRPTKKETQEDSRKGRRAELLTNGLKSSL
ncbi:hypothetical protein D6B99_16955 [Arachidicoccus soli]|uniref:Uncharacterized protein n=1 Tax=Arachidicoccus soli TaxID=2341117 RepID=A0A386HTV7_9BACT|nr:hypothetical protein D6B99_01275 [Arachidicoccus soli]AYD46987.1 hypothetical protein D6B99_04780 [Arachidicoccus soli]AYD48360.1 hypothetical protein D6B99_12570 [Arachidicoccus soli]AYD48585.1 hypothetical protein D6B99_13830 [Arachidicoccus soli]AYD48595.1 hypothetical protein D6B99_13880 [Arachidicoccus soli]